VQGGPEAGLYRLDLSTGAIRQLDATHVWTAFAGERAWTGDSNPADPNPPEGPGAWDELLALDVQSGRLITWVYMPGQYLSIAGFEIDGSPIVRAAASLTEPSTLAVVRQPGEVMALSAVPPLAPGDQVFVDGHGIWIDSGTSLRLYQADGSVKTIQMSEQATLLGPCR
jgi:hypothetical protein